MLQVLNTPLGDVKLIQPQRFGDNRGWFAEVFNQSTFSAAGLPEQFVQDNQSRSLRGTLRGLHAQLLQPQGKLIRALQGEIFDVAVDIRPGSPTFGKWTGATLSADDFRQMFVPPGLAHGFCVLSDFAEVAYKCTDFYDPDDEIGVRWNDPDLGIDWPIRDPLLSEQDATLPTLFELRTRIGR